VKNAALLLAVMIMHAAGSGTAKGETMPTSYFESFSVPFDPRVPPIYPASTLSDEFRAQSPSLLSMPGFVAIDPKWTKFEPGSIKLAGVGIEPQRQMLLLSGSAPKNWNGVMQDLPIPIVGETLNYSIVARGLNAFVQADALADYAVMSWGLLLGENMRVAPTTTDLWGCFAQLSRTSNAIAAATMTSGPIAYDSPAGHDSIWDGVALNWFRADVQIHQVSPGVFTTNLAFHVSESGASWQNLYVYSLDVPLRQFALAQRSQAIDDGPNVGLGTWFDLVRDLRRTDVEGDEGPLLGQPLQQGSI
jgi:hypothetical protein